MRKKIAIWLSDIAADLDIAIAEHARKDHQSPCKWYCKPGARLCDLLRTISNKIYR